jgi:hypothetical protein
MCVSEIQVREGGTIRCLPSFPDAFPKRQHEWPQLDPETPPMSWGLFLAAMAAGSNEKQRAIDVVWNNVHLCA